MNQLDELLRSTLDHHAHDAPPPGRVVSRVLERERPRRYRTGWPAVAAVATATAAMVAIGMTLLGGEDGALDRDTGPAAAFAERQVTYAEGSTIHYGGDSIDVSPYEVVVLVPTDDGFVFADQDLNVLFTDGEGVTQIGQLGGFSGDEVLAADSTGSYAGWIDGTEAVVYDTADRAEVLREALPAGDESFRTIAAIDDDHAYVQHADGVDVWNLTDHTKTTISRPDELGDVAARYLMWHSGGSSVVNRDPQAEQPVFPKADAAPENHLSPSGTYVVGWMSVFDRETQQDVTPDDGPRYQTIVQWLDDDRYIADTQNILTSVDPGPHDLLTCSVSAGSCQVAVQSLRAITYPNGIAPEGAWEG